MKNRFLLILASIAMLLGISTMVSIPASAGVQMGAAPIAAKKVPGNVDSVAPGLPVIDKKTGKTIGDLQADGKVDHYSARTACTYPAVCRNYIGTYQFIGGADGMTVTTSQHFPKKESGDYHTLWQIAAQGASASGNGNMIELGWRVAGTSSLCSSSTNPCLFAGARVNGVWQGYVTGTSVAGYYVDNPTEAVNATTPLAITASGASPTVFYDYATVHTSSAKCDNVTTDGTAVQTTPTPGWLIYQQNTAASLTRLIGCFLDSNWTTQGETFTSLSLTQSFNEIASNDTNPCGDMGYGTYGVSTTPSASQDTNAYSLTNPGVGVTASWGTSGAVSPASASPNGYRIYQNSTQRYRSGGPGFDVAGGTAGGSVGSC